MKTYWWSGRPNFGDALTPILLAAMGVDVEWSPAAEAELFAIGSIAGRIPPRFRGTVLGTGAMYAHQHVELGDARVLALRGPLTGGAPLYADLGLAVALIAPNVERDIELGEVRHYVDARRGRGHLINCTDDPLRVIAQIARCQRIVSSSLHGLIAADALGIPSRWEPHRAVNGDGFKFRDYAAGYRARPMTPGVWAQADPLEVADKLAGLRAAVDVLTSPSIRTGAP